MQHLGSASYTSLTAVTPSNTATINCRALIVGVAGNVVIIQGPVGNPSTPVTVALNANTIYPIELNQGLVTTASTATGIVALA